MQLSSSFWDWRLEAVENYCYYYRLAIEMAELVDFMGRGGLGVVMTMAVLSSVL